MHLHLLSKLAYCLRDQRLRDILGKQCNSEAIMAVILDIENDIGKAVP
jgi:PTS system nitrogen regulatory IIA component